MHVVHVEGGTDSGSTRVVLDLSSRLDPSRFRSSICYFAVRPPLPRVVSETERRGIPWSSVVKKSRYDGTAPERLRRALTELRPDVVVLHGFGAYGIGTLPARSSGARAVVRMEHQPELTNPFRHFVSAASAAWVDGALGVSRFVLTAIAESGVRLPSPEVLYNGIDLTTFAAPAREPFSDRAATPILTMVARLDVQKDHWTLLRSLAELKRRGVTVLTRIVGDGPLAVPLKDEAARLGLSDRVEWLGYRADVRDLLEAADIAVLATHFEGFGLSAAEAMAAARPVIATDVGALSEVVEAGRTGLLVAHEDPVALADAVQAMIADPDAARAMGIAGRAVAVHRFDLRVTVAGFADYLLRLTDGMASESPSSIS